MMTLFSTALAAGNTGTVTVPTDRFNTDLTLGGAITWAMTAIMIIAGLAFFFMLIFGGVKWIISGGDKANTEAARNQVTAAIVGLVIIFSAYIIINFLSGIFGIEVFGNLNFGEIQP